MQLGSMLLLGLPEICPAQGWLSQQMLCGVQVGGWLVTVFDLRHF